MNENILHLFDGGGKVAQEFGRGSLNGVYVHLGASLWMFVAAIFAFVVIWRDFHQRQQGWVALLSGIFFLGLLGLGEGVEHLFTSRINGFFHYLHMLATPVGLFFLYVAVEELRLLYFHQTPRKLVSFKITGLTFAVVVAISAGLGLQGTHGLDLPIEMTFLTVTVLPAMVIAYLLLRRSLLLFREQHRVPLFSLTTVSTILTLIPILAWGAVVLAMTIWAGRLCAILGWDTLQALFSAAQDLFHGGMGAILWGSTIVLLLSSDAKTSEARVVQSSKLVSLGEMAAEVAADLNNPLMSIVGCATVLLEDDEIPAHRKHDLELIIKDASEAAKATQGLLEFAGKPKPKLQVVSIEEPLDEAISLMHGRLRQLDVKIVKSMQKPLPFVAIEKDQIKQAFINVMNNAVDATLRGGQLEIYVTREDDDIEISFTDTGSGMSAQTLDHIFEPFYSSKGGGTGLGLSLAKSIMEKHLGNITVTSECGIGTTMTLRLPTIADEQAKCELHPTAGACDT